MKKLLVLLYGITNYNLGSAALVYLIAFLFNLYVPWTIDSGEAGNPWLAIAIDTGLITLFGLQHSIMARQKFKKWLTRYIPESAERSTFMAATAVVTFSMCLLWQPLPGIVWKAENETIYNIVLACGLAGWALVLYATFLINHFDLFGLRQVWLYFRGEEYTPLAFQFKSLYKYIRHPIMTGAFIGIWFTPEMTAGHLLFATGMSLYIIIGVYHEEKDLVRHFGDRYLSYVKSTSRFFPLPVRNSTAHKNLLDNEYNG
jgi:protein-S-isoprenylcysteine O-methyltransferase Ste14